MTRRAPQSGVGSIFGNKMIHLGLGKSIKASEENLWRLVFNDNALILVNKNMHM